MTLVEAETVDVNFLIQQATALIQAGNLDQGQEIFDEILKQVPTNIASLSGSGVVESMRGNHSKAIELFKKAHAQDPTEIQVLQNLGHAYMAVHLKAEARDAFKKSFNLNENEAQSAYWIAQLSEQLGDNSTAEAFYKHSLKADPNNLQAYLQLGNSLFLQDKNLEALQTLRNAEQQFPTANEISFLRDRLVSKSSPDWHLPMIDDTVRNDAFEAAIKVKVKQGDTVLDIGTGSGLLAMMAIRAGAKHAYAIESDPILAALAAETVLKNGMQDRITIIAKHSTDVVIGEDMPEKADILITETFDSAIIGEGAVPTIRHAHENLLKENPRVIPEGATLFGTLVQCPGLRCFKQINTVSGFDLTPMNALTQPYSHKDTQLFFEVEEAHTLSTPVIVNQFIFESALPELIFQTEEQANIIENGTADAVRLWFDLQLAPGITFSTEHSKAQYHWRPVCQIIRQDVTCKKGETKVLHTNFQEFFNFAVR